ncbi:MAG TPA: RNA polymerase sigma factor [Gemmatimonadales bacterium]|nr:RNA polymerase sigma factor [Gemmatimonadales bacterium]
MSYAAVRHAIGPTAEAVLVRECQAGNERAATELVALHGAAVARFLYSSGADSSDVEDLVQETFFRAFRNLGSWRGDAGLRGWLCSIAANALRDAYRRAGKRRLLPLDDHDVPAPGNPVAELVMQDTAEQLRRGIAQLPRLQREVFLLRTQEGLEYTAIAAALGTTAGAARVHYHGAVRRLKAMIA